jgi:hypothetical protein
MNIGGGNGSYTYIPIYWELDSIRDFTDSIRSEMFKIILWSHDNFGIKSQLWLGIHIYQDISDDEFYERDFIINCKNIREFKQYANIRKTNERESKLNNILK